MNLYTITQLGPDGRETDIDITERADTLATERARSWLRGGQWSSADGEPIEVTALIERHAVDSDGEDYIAEDWRTTVTIDPHTLEIGPDDAPSGGWAA